MPLFYISVVGMSVDKLLAQVSESLSLTSASLDSVLESLSQDADARPELVTSLLRSINSKNESANPLEPVSLLSLKNSSLLGYITDLALLMQLRLQSMQSDRPVLEDEKDEILKSSVVHRVTLERGIKSLEKKLSYQLEKLTAAYQRKEKEHADIEDNVQKRAGDSDEEDRSGSDNEDEEDASSEDEGLNLKPNLGALMGKDSAKAFKKKPAQQQQQQQEDSESGSDDDTKSKGKYKPPKIAAMALQADPDKEIKSNKKRNLQSMDEYLQDISDAPMAEKSIGATITNEGRDMKTKRQLEKEAEVQRYEEENFTRLPATKLKENKKDRAKRMRNEFFGEDWSMFDNKRDFNTDSGNANKKRKPQNAWSKAKRKIN